MTHPELQETWRCPSAVSQVRGAKTTERMDTALWLANGLEAFQDELPRSAASIMLQVQSQLRSLGRGVQTHGLYFSWNNAACK